MLESEENSKEYRKNWTRVIQKIYEVDPLTCPQCQGQMRIIRFIEDSKLKPLEAILNVQLRLLNPNDTSIIAEGMQLAISTCDGCDWIMEANRFRNTIEVSTAICILKCV